MLKIENVKVVGLDAAIRGMRNPMNSWDKSDSFYTHVVDTETGMQVDDQFFVGENDLDLMKRLAASGSDHAKFRRMIVVYMDITAPLYWWKEFDTYKVGTVANSCSTMHKIHSKPFEIEDFSHEHLFDDFDNNPDAMLRAQIPCNQYDNGYAFPLDILGMTVDMLNKCRTSFNITHDKRYWWQMIQLLPSSYNQRRTVMLNYEVLHNIYHARRNHKLDEWHVLCDQIEDLPYSELITSKPDAIQIVQITEYEYKCDICGRTSHNISNRLPLGWYQIDLTTKHSPMPIRFCDGSLQEPVGACLQKSKTFHVCPDCCETVFTLHLIDMEVDHTKGD